ncbi:MAG: hypothetical protein Q8M31_21675 [Beijerinckiaceae bacterium]|nr:hypothetical protein [Beijerinckiaceae bacterium]
MSLVSLAIRWTLWRALYGKTYAGERVYDSAVAPIEDMVSEEPHPFLTISTEDESGEVSGHDYAEANRTLDINVEIALATELRMSGRPNVPHTDEGLEMAINLIGRQVMYVLQADPSPWADLFRWFACSGKKLHTRRGADVEKGIRFAARQVTITVEPIHEPEFGAAPSGVWARLIAEMREDDILSVYADTLHDAIIGEAVPDWRRLIARLGLTNDGASAVGIGPLIPDEAPLTAGELSSDGDQLAFAVEPSAEADGLLAIVAVL